MSLPVHVQGVDRVQAPTPPVDQRVFESDMCPDFVQKYSLKHELGAGGFGFVYSCTRRADSQTLACKFIIKAKVPKNCWTLDAQMGVCPMEALVLKNVFHLIQVQHSCIIEFVDYIQDDVYCYLITTLHGSQWGQGEVRSMDLFECIERNEKFSESQGRFVFRQIVDAVCHLYSLGLVHRDIKDENILIDDQYHIKLIDFGSVSFFDPTASTHFERFLGTIQYASPEILAGKSYHGPSAEVWSLGCCLYIILTGQVFFI